MIRSVFNLFHRHNHAPTVSSKDELRGLPAEEKKVSKRILDSGGTAETVQRYFKEQGLSFSKKQIESDYQYQQNKVQLKFFFFSSQIFSQKNMTKNRNFRERSILFKTFLSRLAPNQINISCVQANLIQCVSYYIPTNKRL